MVFKKLFTQTNISGIIIGSTLSRIIFAIILYFISAFIFLIASIYETKTRTTSKIASTIADEITWFIQSYKNTAEAIGCIPELSMPNIPPKLKQILIANKAKEFNFDFGGIIRKDGWSDYDNRYRGDRYYFKEALNGVSSVNDPVHSRTSGMLQLIFGAPIWKGGIYHGTIDSILYIGVDPETLNDIMRKHGSLTNKGQAYIINKSGTVIASEDSSLVYDMTNHIHIAATNKKFDNIAKAEKKMLKGKPTSQVVYNNGMIYLYTSYPIENTPDWILVMTSPFTPQLTMLFYFILAFGLTSLLVLFLSYKKLRKVSNGISNPIMKMADRIHSASVGDFSSEINRDYPLDEIRTISEATQNLINRMNFVLNPLTTESASDISTQIRFSSFMKIQENFSKTLNLVLCIYDKKMNPILGNPQPEALNPRRFNIIINKKVFGTCEISPKENCTLSDIEIECIGESVSELISRLIENSIEKEIRYEGWKKNEQYNLESLVKSTENLKKDISEWLETKENDPSQNNSQDIGKIFSDIKKNFSNIAVTSKYAKLTDYNSNIIESDYETSEIINSIQEKIHNEISASISFAASSKIPVKLFGDPSSITKAIIKTTSTIEEKWPEADKTITFSSEHNQFCTMLSTKIAMFNPMIGNEEIRRLMLISKQTNLSSEKLDVFEQNFMAAFKLVHRLNGNIIIKSTDKTVEMEIKIPQLSALQDN